MKGLPLVAISLALTAILQSPVKAQKKEITIHQDIYFDVTPQQLYLTLLSSEQFSASTKRSFDMFSPTSDSQQV